MLPRSAEGYVGLQGCSPIRLAFVGTPDVDRPTLLLDKDTPECVAALMNVSAIDPGNVP